MRMQQKSARYKETSSNSLNSRNPNLRQENSAENKQSFSANNTQLVAPHGGKEIDLRNNNSSNKNRRKRE